MATEEPAFSVVVQEGAFEVRDYPALVAAEVSVAGGRDEASNAGFRLLAGYIFGGNTRRQSIAMTAPVVQERATSGTIAMTAPVTQSGSDGAWVVRFAHDPPRAVRLCTFRAVELSNRIAHAHQEQIRALRGMQPQIMILRRHCVDHGAP